MATLRAWFYLNLARVYYWMQRRVARKAIRLKRLSLGLLDAEVRTLKPDLLQFGEDDELDLVIECVVRELTRQELPPDLGIRLGNATAVELLGLARKSDAVSQVVARYHAADAFFAGLLKEEGRKTTQMQLARSSSPALQDYDAGDIYREHKKTLNRLRALIRQLAERSALKVEFSVASISSGVALVSAIFVVAGFLYVRYFYQRVGVDVSLYFSVGDYLAASVEQIRSGAFAAAIALGTFVLGVRSGSLKSRLHIRATARTRQRERWVVGLITLALCGASAYWIYVDKPDFSLLLLSCLLASYWIADYVAAAFFKNRLAAMTCIVGVLIFGANVAVSAYERSDDLLTGRKDAPLRQRVLFKDSSPPVSGELFGANGSYYFVYSRQDGVTHVVPRDRVAQIDIAKSVR